MEVKVFAEKLFAAGREMGFDAMEAYVASRNLFRVGVFKSEIDSYTLAQSRGLSFRGIINGRMGYSFTENLSADSVALLVDDARANAAVIDSEDPEEIFGGSPEATYADICSFSPALEQVLAAEKITWVKEVEQKAYGLDVRVSTVQVSLGNSSGETMLMNTKGLNLAHQGNFADGYVAAVVKEGEDTKSAYAFFSSRDFSRFDPATLAKEAVDEAISLLGAASIESGQYPVLLRHDVAGEFLATFASSFSAEAVQKGLSLLKDKQGEQIMSSNITIIDDPHMPERPNSAPFDAEGVATAAKEVVLAGRLMTLLHNLKTAKKDGVNSTGNAYKMAFNAPVTVAPTNLYIQPGKRDYADLVAHIEHGLIIIAVQGTHSGANPVSGDFSLSAYGYLVRGGQVVRPVNQVTIAGNFFKMLSDVQEVGNDLHFKMGSIAAPSLLIGSLAVSGK
ncbi:MAG: Metalloprotease PmbA [Firmicutes bacterium]|nr:Metalloprotease PmbA [Bacillota bacterium]